MNHTQIALVYDLVDTFNVSTSAVRTAVVLAGVHQAFGDAGQRMLIDLVATTTRRLRASGGGLRNQLESIASAVVRAWSRLSIRPTLLYAEAASSSHDTVIPHPATEPVTQSSWSDPENSTPALIAHRGWASTSQLMSETARYMGVACKGTAFAELFLAALTPEQQTYFFANQLYQECRCTCNSREDMENMLALIRVQPAQAGAVVTAVTGLGGWAAIFLSAMKIGGYAFHASGAAVPSTAVVGALSFALSSVKTGIDLYFPSPLESITAGALRLAGYDSGGFVVQQAARVSVLTVAMAEAHTASEPWFNRDMGAINAAMQTAEAARLHMTHAPQQIGAATSAVAQIEAPAGSVMPVLTPHEQALQVAYVALEAEVRAYGSPAPNVELTKVARATQVGIAIGAAEVTKTNFDSDMKTTQRQLIQDIVTARNSGELGSAIWTWIVSTATVLGGIFAARSISERVVRGTLAFNWVQGLMSQFPLLAWLFGRFALPQPATKSDIDRLTARIEKSHARIDASFDRIKDILLIQQRAGGERSTCVQLGPGAFESVPHPRVAVWPIRPSARGNQVGHREAHCANQSERREEPCANRRIL